MLTPATTLEDVMAAIELAAEALHANGDRDIVLSGVMEWLPEYTADVQVVLAEIEEDLSPHYSHRCGSFAEGYVKPW